MSKVLNFLGIAQKAGVLTLGGNLTEAGVKKNKILLIMISEDASENTRKRFNPAAENTKYQLLELHETMEELGRATGKSNISVIGVTDAGIAKKLKELAMIM